MTKNSNSGSFIFPHSDKEFGMTSNSDWPETEKVNFNRGALRGFLTDILPNRDYAYHYAIHYEMDDDNQKLIENTWKSHVRLFPVPNHLINKGSRIYFFYKWEIVGNALVEELIYNVPHSEYNEVWNPRIYPLIVKFRRDSIRLFPSNSINKEVMRTALTPRTLRSLPMFYLDLTEDENQKLQDAVEVAVSAYLSLF